MDHEEFMFFLTGGVGLENKLQNPAPQWLSDRSWDEICRMCDLKAFKGTIYILVLQYVPLIVLVNSYK